MFDVFVNNFDLSHAYSLILLMLIVSGALHGAVKPLHFCIVSALAYHVAALLCRSTENVCLVHAHKHTPALRRTCIAK